MVQPGESVVLVDADGRRLPDAVVTEVVAAGKMTPPEGSFVAAQRFVGRLRTGWNPDGYMVTLDRPVELAAGAVIASAGRRGDGFLVQGCTFGENRSRGILIKASRGKVVGNTLFGTRGEAIKVAPEWQWLEAGDSDEVTIANNIIRDCGSIAIAVYASSSTGALAPAGAHRDIAITGNTFQSCPLPNIVVTSTDGGRVADNQFVLTPTLGDAKRALRTLHLERELLRPMMIENSRNVSIGQNQILPGLPR